LQWRRRIRGSKRQLGKPFPLLEKKKLPKLDVPSMALRYAQRKHWRKLNPESAITKIIRVDPNELVFREKKPVDLQRRAQYFIRMHMDGRPIPPILVYKIPGGRYKIYDGHARVYAFRLLGIKSIPAILKKDNSGIGYKESKAIREGLMVDAG